MKIHEVLKNVGSDLNKWFRPVSFRGMGTAFAVKHGVIVFVPSSEGGIRATLTASQLMEDWEIVDPDDVLDE